MNDKNLNAETNMSAKAQEVIKELNKILEKSGQGGKFCVFLSKLVKEKEEEKLQHHMFTVNFKDDDIPIALDEYKKLAYNHLQAVRGQESPKSNQLSTPKEENSSLQGQKKGQTEKFRVEDDKSIRQG